MQSGEKRFREDDINEKISDKKEKKSGNEERGGIFSRFGGKLKEKLTEKSEREVRERLSRFVGFLLTAVVTWLLCGAELFFGLFPLCIALSCSTRRHLGAVALGILLASLGGLPDRKSVV